MGKNTSYFAFKRFIKCSRAESIIQIQFDSVYVCDIKIGEAFELD
jgi:hypothetical protein